MAIAYQQKCFRCKKNYVKVTSRQRFSMCYDCQKNELSQPIKNKEMKKMFAIPEEFYKQNSFLRDIKLNYIKFESLSEKQIEAFKKTVKDLKAAKKDAAQAKD